MNKIKETMILVFTILCITSTCYAQQWAMAYGGAGSETFRSIHQTPDGRYSVVFETDSFDSGSIIALKLNTDGTISWQKIYDIGTIYGVATVELTNSGKYMIGIIAPSSRGLLLKLDADGEVIWYKELFDCAITCNLHSFKQTSDRGFASLTSAYGFNGGGVSLTKYDSDGNKTWRSDYHFGQYTNSYHVWPTNDGGCVLPLSTSGYPTPFIFKLDTDGNIAWQKTYDRSVSLSHPIRQTQDGGYVAIGEGNWMMKLDIDGDVVWAKEYTGEPQSIWPTLDGGYILLIDKSGKSALLKLNQSGNIIWQKSYEGGNLHSIQETSDGGYILAGSTESFGVGSSDVWVLKVNQHGDIPQCDIVGESDVTSTDIHITSDDTSFEAPPEPAQGSLLSLPDVPISSETSNAEATQVCFYTGPDADIKANGQDGAIIVPHGDQVSIEVSLDPGNYPGVQADWWVLANTPVGFYYKNLFSGWKPGLSVTHQGPLFNLTPPLEVLNTSGLPKGNYTFYFGVDGNKNGILDQPLFYDSVEVNITPP
jgi:hypothetical protein